MTYNDLQFYDVTLNQGSYDYTVHGFDINSRYHGYTYDYELFNVYDETTNAYTSYSKTDFETALSSGTFDNGGIQNINPVNSVSSFQPADWLKFAFIGGVVIMLIYIAKA